MPANAAPRVEYAVAKDSLTSFADLPFIARLRRGPHPFPSTRLGPVSRATWAVTW